MIQHPIPPIYDENSNVLILGSFPSVKSRAANFYYGHPQNRFWRVLAGVYETEVPLSIEEKRNFILEHHIALWDVIASCEIIGSSDSSIRNVIPNDLSPILNTCNINKIYVNGRKAEALYKRYLEPTIGIKPVCLPSTSPANAAWDLSRLIDAWRIIKK